MTNSFVVRLLTIDNFYLDYECYMSSVEHLQRTLNLDGEPFGVDIHGRHVPNLPTDQRWPANSDIEFAVIAAAWCHIEWKFYRSSFTYVVLDRSESRELGNGYIFPCHKEGYDVECQSWVRSDEYEKGLDVEFYEWFRRWVEDVWPFDGRTVGWPGREMTWEKWNELPDKAEFTAARERERGLG